ncbi:MAG: hypothetical protein ABIA66_00200 [Candidatus Omnitrophota bacterium]
MVKQFFEELEEPKNIELTTQYRLTFGSDVGKRVLANILVDFCGFLAYIDPNDQATVGQYNVAVAILGRLGILNAGKEAIIKAILDIPVME